MIHFTGGTQLTSGMPEWIEFQNARGIMTQYGGGLESLYIDSLQKSGRVYIHPLNPGVPGETTAEPHGGFYYRPDLQNHIFLRSDLFTPEAQETNDIYRQVYLASVMVHEVWHAVHRAIDEPKAYERQLQWLQQVHTTAADPRVRDGAEQAAGQLDEEALPFLKALKRKYGFQ